MPRVATKAAVLRLFEGRPECPIIRHHALALCGQSRYYYKATAVGRLPGPGTAVSQTRTVTAFRVVAARHCQAVTY